MRDERTIRIHGHDVAYHLEGSGPALVLLHGVTSSSQTWRAVLPALSRAHSVLVPDLLGHGKSAKPRGDYSMGAFASGVRDLMVAVGIDRATVVGHSLGGGIAMQLAYQFPERVERLALVASGGLGSSVHRLLRAATLPGSELVLPLLAHRAPIAAAELLGKALDRVGIRLGTDGLEMARGHASLRDPEARQAFIHTLRASIDPGGQRVDARDRLYLARVLPTLIVWGAKDPIIPCNHGRRAHELLPGSRLEIFDEPGHFPHVEQPERFARVLEDWIATTDPNEANAETFRALIRG